MNYKFIDKTAEIARYYSVDWGCNAPSSPALASKRHGSVASFDKQSFTEASVLSDTVGSHSSENSIPPPRADSNLAGYSPYGLLLSPRNHSSLLPTSPGYFQSGPVSPGSANFPPNLQNGSATFDEHEACLMRYFVVQLAPWVSYFPV